MISIPLVQSKNPPSISPNIQESWSQKFLYWITVKPKLKHTHKSFLKVFNLCCLSIPYNQLILKEPKARFSTASNKNISFGEALMSLEISNLINENLKTPTLCVTHHKHPDGLRGWPRVISKSHITYSCCYYSHD